MGIEDEVDRILGRKKEEAEAKKPASAAKPLPKAPSDPEPPTPAPAPAGSAGPSTPADEAEKPPASPPQAPANDSETQPPGSESEGTETADSEPEPEPTPAPAKSLPAPEEPEEAPSDAVQKAEPSDTEPPLAVEEVAAAEDAPTNDALEDVEDDGKPRIALSHEREAARHGSVTHDLESPEEADEAPPDVVPTEAETAGLSRKEIRRLQKKRKEEGLVHSSQLDERMRRGDAEARPLDHKLKLVFDSINMVSIGLLVAVTVGAAGFLSILGTVPAQVYTLAAVATLLAGNSILFNQVRWRALRGHQGIHVLEKWKADLQLTIVSIVALFTVVFITAIEVTALLAFTGLIQVGTAGSAVARNFALFQIIILLVYALTLVVREQNVTSYQPHPKAVLASRILTPVAGVVALLGVLLTTGGPQSVGMLSSISRGQGIYIVTLGVGLEFIAVRIRLRLPSVLSLFKAAVDVSKRANEEVRLQLQKKAQRTYIASFVFVAISMAFAGAIASGNIGVGSGSATLALVIFYVGTAVVLLGLVAVRVFQSRNMERRTVKDETDLERLVGQKRKSTQEIYRIAVYSVTGFIGFLFAAIAFLVGTESLPLLPKTYATDLFIVALLFGAGPYGFYFNAERKRISAIDDKFPDFLRDIAESARAGMTLPRALVTAAGGSYGALTEDIRQMAAQVEWGVEFAESLERFAERANTPLIDRTVSLVVEAQRAGGNVVDILTAASDDAREIKQIVSERDEQMQMYSVVVYIAYFVFIAVVLILSAQFIPAFKEAVGAASGQQVGGLNFKDFDPEDFNTLFFHAALVQAIGGGLVGGVLTKGHPVAGFNNIMIMVVAAWLSFRVMIGVI